MVDAPVDVLGEAAEVGFERGHRLSVFAELEPLVEPVANGALVLLRNAKQHPDGAHRHLGSEVGDEIEAARTDERIKARLQNRRTWGSTSSIAFGWNTRLSRPRWKLWAGGSSNRISPEASACPT